MIKRSVERLLARGLVPWLASRDTDGMSVLAYHNVVPDGAEPGADGSLHLPRLALAAQLDALMETHRVIALRELVERVKSGGASSREASGDRPLAAVTFDDAYRGALEAGLPEVAARDLPATVFVSPGLLGSDGFWWDRLDASAQATVDREQLLGSSQGRADRILENLRRRSFVGPPPPTHARPATEEQLVAAARIPGITFGSHGWNHANLVELADGELEAQLRRPREWLRATLGDAAVPFMAYPYGRSSDRVEAAAREVGYEAGFVVDDRSVDPGSARTWGLSRINIPAGVSLDGFRLRAFGISRSTLVPFSG